MEGYVKASLKPSSQSCYADILKTYLIPSFGGRPINEITRKNIKDFIYEKKAAGYAPRTVASMIHRMSSIFENAIEDGIATVNPTRRPGKHIGQPKLGEGMSFLEKKEGMAVLEAARKHYPT